MNKDQKEKGTIEFRPMIMEDTLTCSAMVCATNIVIRYGFINESIERILSDALQHTAQTKNELYVADCNGVMQDAHG